MRMRKKKHGAERIAACADLLIPSPPEKDIREYLTEDRPLCLEIGCGKGGFACGLTSAERDINLVAVEKYSDAACLALEKAKASKDCRPDNLRFMIADASALGEYFPEHSVSCIYLNFSDPWPKSGYYKRRLTYASFLEIYRKLLVPGGILKQKTDNEGLFEFSLEQFAAAGLDTFMTTRDLHSSPYAENNIVTEYEAQFSAKGMPIYSAWVRF